MRVNFVYTDSISQLRIRNQNYHFHDDFKNKLLNLAQDIDYLENQKKMMKEASVQNYAPAPSLFKLVIFWWWTGCIAGFSILIDN